MTDQDGYRTIRDRLHDVLSWEAHDLVDDGSPVLLASFVVVTDWLKQETVDDVHHEMLVIRSRGPSWAAYGMLQAASYDLSETWTSR